SIHCSLSLLVLKIHLLRKQKRLKNSCMNWIVLIGKWLKQNKIKSSCGKLVMKFLLLSAIKKVKIFYVRMFVYLYHNFQVWFHLPERYCQSLDLKDGFLSTEVMVIFIHLFFTMINQTKKCKQSTTLTSNLYINLLKLEKHVQV